MRAIGWSAILIGLVNTISPGHAPFYLGMFNIFTGLVCLWRSTEP
jgi:hypothetical protein